jgi:CheY-like chemotaxis protein
MSSLYAIYEARVEGAESAVAALDLLRGSSGYDIVLLDVEMEELNGLEAYPEMIAAGNCGQIVLMSGNPTHASEAHELKAAFLAKPFDPEDQLLKWILRHCEGPSHA